MIKTLTACSHFTSIPETTKMTMKYKENKQRKMYSNSEFIKSVMGCLQLKKNLFFG